MNKTGERPVTKSCKYSYKDALKKYKPQNVEVEDMK